jgi:hypothetical protein
VSRTTKGTKGPGYTYWGRRPGRDLDPGRRSKTRTHRVERRRADEQVRDAYEEMTRRSVCRWCRRALPFDDEGRLPEHTDGTTSARCFGSGDAFHHRP